MKSITLKYLSPLILLTTLCKGQAPDAGTLLREQPKPELATPHAVPAKLSLSEQPTESADEGQRFFVSEIKFTGNTLISTADLQARIKGLAGEERSLTELKNAASFLIGYYTQRGYLARVYLPEQDIIDGVVTFDVVEGKLGQLKVQDHGQRIDVDRVKRFVSKRLPQSGPMNISELGEALNILNEQPGAAVASAVSLGDEIGEVDLSVTARDMPMVSSFAMINNYGSRATGEIQGGFGLSLNNPTGNFDELSIYLNKSEGITYGQAEYSLALGDRGLRLSGSASGLDYKIVQSDFEALGSNGTARTGGLSASFPWKRRSHHRLDSVVSYEYSALVDETSLGETGDRTVQATRFGFSGYDLVPSPLFRGYITYWTTLSFINSDESNPDALAADELGRQTNGSAVKMAWRASWIRPISEKASFSLSARGQFANQNLDSSERFSLGGSSGISAYPLAEGTGDEGWMLKAKFDRQLTGSLTFTGFTDLGSIKINHDIPVVGAPTENQYTLKDLGISLSWMPFERTSVHLTLATPIGNNPGEIKPDQNADGSSHGERIWLGASTRF